MRYWFARIVLGATWVEVGKWATGQSTAVKSVYISRSKRRTYARLRATGMSSIQAYARMNCLTTAQARANRRKYSQARKRRWGGHQHIGSRSWVERETYKLAVKLQAIGG